MGVCTLVLLRVLDIRLLRKLKVRMTLYFSDSILVGMLYLSSSSSSILWEQMSVTVWNSKKKHAVSGVFFSLFECTRHQTMTGSCRLQNMSTRVQVSDVTGSDSQTAVTVKMHERRQGSYLLLVTEM